MNKIWRVGWWREWSLITSVGRTVRSPCGEYWPLPCNWARHLSSLYLYKHVEIEKTVLANPHRRLDALKQSNSKRKTCIYIKMSKSSVKFGERGFRDDGLGLTETLYTSSDPLIGTRPFKIWLSSVAATEISAEGICINWLDFAWCHETVTWSIARADAHGHDWPPYT